jgi:hypothetical protein
VDDDADVLEVRRLLLVHPALALVLHTRRPPPRLLLLLHPPPSL